MASLLAFSGPNTDEWFQVPKLVFWELAKPYVARGVIGKSG